MSQQLTGVSSEKTGASPNPEPRRAPSADASNAAQPAPPAPRAAALDTFYAPYSPLKDLKSVSAAVSGASAPLTDADIMRYRDEVKRAIINLRDNVGSDIPTETRAKIAYQLDSRAAFIEAVGTLLDAARSRDPYAPQLQIG